MTRFGRVSGFLSDEAQRTYLEAYDDTLSLCPVPLEPFELTTPFGATHGLTCGPAAATPIVVLPGKNCSSTMWLDLLPVLTASQRVHLVDPIGDLGRSVATTMMHGRSDVVRWLDAVLDGLQIDRSAFVGLSNGAFLSATYAMERPERVDRLALLAPAGVVAGLAPSWWLSLLSSVLSRDKARVERFWFSHYVSAEPSALRLKFDRQFLIGNGGMRLATRDVLPHRYGSKRLASLTMPILLVFASNDVVHDGPKAAAKARRLLPSARVELLQDCGHFMTFDRLAAVSILLTEFQSETPAPPANLSDPTVDTG